MSEFHHALKEGYLLTQTASKKWKVRWFVLSEDKLTCCHRRSKSIINSLPLRGCSVVCPDPNNSESVSPGSLKLYLPEGEELLLQSSGYEDRDRWAHVLGAVIRCLSTSQEIIHNKMSFKEFHAQANVSEIIGALQDPDAGIESSNHLRGGTVFKNCFTGGNIVDWLLRWSLVRNRANGASMGQALLKLGHLQEVDLRDGTSGYSSKFSDNEKLYRFTSINVGAKRHSFYDSGDSDSSSSEEEDEEDEDEDDCDSVEQKVKKGKIIKEGFLAKKRKLRKGWKVLKVIVRDTPPSLQYFRAKYIVPSEEKFPSKLINLDKCKVMEIIKPPKAIKGTSSGVGAAEFQASMMPKEAEPRYRLVLRRNKGRALTFQMLDEQQKQEWLTALSPLCKPRSGESNCK